MKVNFCFFYLFFMLNAHRSLSQNEITYADISYLKFYTPRLEYMKNNVKEVVKSIEVIPTKKKVIEHSYYDKNGYLVFQENWDTISLDKKESIKVEQVSGVSIVKRKIKKEFLSKMQSCYQCFWQWYYPLRKHWESVPDSIITVKSFYKFAVDSGLYYKTSINGKEIDTGYLVTNLTTSDYENDYQALKTDTIFHQDTLLLRIEQKLTSTQQVVITKYYLKGLVVKSEEKRYLNNSLFSCTYVLFKYNDKDLILSEEYHNMNENDFCWKMRHFEYMNKNNSYRIIENIFSNEGSLNTINIYSDDSKILEIRHIGAGGVVINNSKYKYLQNGLLEEVCNYYNGIIKSKYYYDYLYD